MIFNRITNCDIEKISSALKRIKETKKIVNEEACDKDYVKWSINYDLDDIIFYAQEMRKDIEK